MKIVRNILRTFTLLLCSSAILASLRTTCVAEDTVVTAVAASKSKMTTTPTTPGWKTEPGKPAHLGQGGLLSWRLRDKTIDELSFTQMAMNDRPATPNPELSPGKRSENSQTSDHGLLGSTTRA